MVEYSSHELRIENISPANLRPDPSNPRAHKAPQIAAIAKSIKTFGFNVPVLADADGQIIAGHGRVLAALKLGLATIPLVRVDHLSSDQRKAYMIADNRLCDVGGWDERLLGEVLRDLSVADIDFELDAIGFSVAEIDMKIEGLDDHSTDSDDFVPELVPGPSVTKPGDLWLAGRHRLLCGDAVAGADWATLMNGEQAAMAFTDPPYNLRIAGHVSGLGRVTHREFAVASGELDRDQFTAFLGNVFAQMRAHSKLGSLHYACMDWRHIGEIMAAGEANFNELKNLCVWVKPAGSMGTLYRSQHEMVFVWKNGRARHRNNVELGRHGRNRTNVWQYPGIAAFRHSEGGDLLASHPTCKPVTLVADAILDVTARGDIVADPFLGSGTTMIAAERVGRQCYGMEIDPTYCDTIIRRYQAMTGDFVVHGPSGRTFDDLAATAAAGERAA